MGQLYTVNIGSKVWQMGYVATQALIKTAKEAFEGKNAIVAVKKNYNIEMKKEEFENKQALEERIKEYVNQGFSVYFVKESDRQCD